MRKTIFAILACCMAVTSAFSQIPVDFTLSEDKPQDESPIEGQNNELGRIFVKILGEPDNQGRTPVQIELENNSDYKFLLCDRAWSKKMLKKDRIYIEKGMGDNTLPIENLDLGIRHQALLLIEENARYTFPEILVEEEKTYVCTLPIHLVKPKPNWFCKKKKIVKRIPICTINITVDNRDEVYDKFKRQCDSLQQAFNRAIEKEEFCTHPRHSVPFDTQTYQYTEANRALRDQIRPYILNKGWSPQSKKYQRYAVLLDSLNKMNNALVQYKNEKHYCGKDTVITHSCAYCKLSLQEIYIRLNKHYINLYNGTVQKSAILREVNALYNCAKYRRNSDQYMSGITEFYNKIKAYRQ